MSENLQEILKVALTNDTYNYDVVHSTIRKTLESSFSYLYSLQRSLVDYKDLVYYSNNEDSRNAKEIGHLYLNSSKIPCFDIEYDIVQVSGREKYRTGSLYKNKFTFLEMLENQDIFPKIPVILIDNQLIWDYSLQVNNGVTTVVLPFKKKFIIEDVTTTTSPVLKRGNVYTITADSITAVNSKGYEINLDYTFIPARVSNAFNAIKQGVDEGKTITSMSDEIREIILDYYLVDEITDEKVVVTSILEDVVYIDHKIQVLVVDNSYYQRIRLNKTNISYNDTKKSITILKSFLTDIPDKQGTMFCSIHVPNENNTSFELGTMLIDMYEDSEQYTATLSDDIAKVVASTSGEFYVSLFFFTDLFRHVFYTEKDYTECNPDDTNLIVLERDKLVPYDMPIPIENFFLMKKSVDSEGYEPIRNLDNVKMYYPNIYQLVDSTMVPGDRYKVFYFYNSETVMQYTPIHDFYYQFLVDIFQDLSMEEMIDGIYHDTIEYSDFTEEQIESFKETFMKIINYEYFKHNFGDMDFLLRYKIEDENVDKSPVEYKIETMRDWETVHPMMLRDYVREERHKGIALHLFANTLDLDDRLRTDTSNELDDDYTFDEEMYVFALSNKQTYPTLLNCRVFVDGLFVMDMYQDRNYYMDYLYIPTRLFKRDSYIEVELFEEYKMFENIQFDSLEDSKSISVIEPPENVAPTLADMVVFNEERTKRYDNSKFDITAHYSEGDFSLKTTDESKPITFSRLSNFTIRPNDESVMGKPLQVQLSKIAQGVRVMVIRTGFVYMEVIEEGFGIHEDYIRIFVNGRILPKTRYKYYKSYLYPRIVFYDEYHQGDIIFVDITPYRYTQIYYNEELSDPTLIDLKGIINKPFDIRYYDVYLNGRRLSLNNVMTIDPWSISLVNLKSVYHLLIFEKERDWEYFGLDYTNRIYYFSVEDLINKPFVTDEERDKIIDRIIEEQKDDDLIIHPNTNDENKENYDEPEKNLLYYAQFDLFYQSLVIQPGFINPDVKQLSREIMNEEYDEVNKVYAIEPESQSRNDAEKERRKKYVGTICLNPDITASYDDELAEDNSQIVYSVGHLSKVSHDILRREIKVDTKPRIDE